MRKTLAGLAIGLGAAAIVLATAAGGALERLELNLYDWRMRTAARTPPDVHLDIVLVEINDTTIRDLEPVFGRWPWPRAAFSMLIDFLHRAPAKVIAMDLGFYEKDRVLQYQIGTDKWTGEESDAALVTAVKSAPETVLLADAVYEGLLSGEQANKAVEWRGGYRLGPRIFERRSIIPPFGALNDATHSLGHNFVALDPGGSLRRVVPFVRTGERAMPWLGVAAALLAADVRPEEITLDGNALKIRDRAVPLVTAQVKDAVTGVDVELLTMLINYRAPALLANGERPYQKYEARHVLNSEIQLLSGEKPDVDPAAFKGKVVFVGLTASGLVDVFQTPFDSKGQGKMPGIQVHASVADSILSNRFITPPTNRGRIGSILVVGLIVGLVTAWLPFTPAALVTLAAIAAWTTWDWFTFRNSGHWNNLSQPLLTMAVALFAGTAYQYFVEGKEKRVVKKLFGRYVSKDVYAQLLANPEIAELGGKRREMTVLFSDIRGFTSVTEKGDPEQLVAQLNEYFSRMVEIVFRHHGTVDKFVGDMVMALFAAPLDDPQHAEHAVAAATDMVRELGELNRKWAAEGRAQLDIGIGVNSGDMIAGNIGSSSIMSYTVIGDNVNLGSRLESLNKDYRTRIIISDATRARLTGRYEIAPLGDVVVKGKSRPVAIFEVKVPSPLEAVTEERAI